MQRTTDLGENSPEPTAYCSIWGKKVGKPELQSVSCQNCHVLVTCLKIKTMATVVGESGLYFAEKNGINISWNLHL